MRSIFLAAALISSPLFADTPAEVRAESFGFDARDSTKALQAALDSGAKRVIVSDQGKPWIVRPIKLRSDLELVFEKGAEVQAMRGEYQKVNASLFAASNAQHLTIRGEGNVLRMWKSDYQQPPYAKSEWRHCLSFHGCSDVTISGLVLEESGGDGIYLGTGGKGGCDRFTIRDVKCLRHHRQGISVINASDLLIEGCTFNETDGTAPMAGIDFEPNSSTERLKNCVLRQCVFDRNASAGVLFALGKLDASSDPISIRLEDCMVRSNASAARIVPRNPAGVRGSIEFHRCVFADSKKIGITLERKTLPGARVIFDRCEFTNLATETKDSAPISILCRLEQGDPVGGIEFKSCTVNDPIDRLPIAYDDMNGLRLKDVTGSLFVNHGDKTKVITLTQALIDSWFPWSADLHNYPHIELKGVPLIPLNGTAEKLPPFRGWLRGQCTFVASVAKAGDVLNFQVVSRGIGRKPDIVPIKVKIVAPSGKTTNLQNAMLATPSDYAFTTAEAGTHLIQIDGGKHAVACQSESTPVNAISLSGAFHFIGATSPLAFLVPEGVKEFSLRVAGDGGLEQVHAIVTNAAGQVVADKDNIARTQQFILKRDDASKDEVWTLKLASPTKAVIEDVHVLFDGVPSIVAPSASALLKPKK